MIISGNVEPVGPAKVHIDKSDHPSNESAADDTTKILQVQQLLMAMIRTPLEVKFQLKRPLKMLQVAFLMILISTPSEGKLQLKRLI